MTDEVKKNPNYWQNLAELADSPDVQEALNTPATDGVKLERRDFLKFMGASLFMASAACVRRPIEKIIPYVNQPEMLTPGVANWYTTTCGSCSAGCGVLVKTREGRPIKLEGNAAHPVNQGALCARGQAGLLDLYDPDRSRVPSLVARGAVSPKEMTWDELDERIKSKLTNLKAEGKSVVVMTDAINSPSTSKLINQFVESLGGYHVAYESVVPEELAIAAQHSYGNRVVPRYMFENAKYVLSFGADFLGSWLSPVQFAKGFSKSRTVEDRNMARFVSFEAATSLTGTNADTNIPLRSGDELLVALGLAHEIIVRMGETQFATNSSVVQALAGYGVASVSNRSGVPVEVLQKTARELVAAKGRGLIIGGPLKNAYAVELQIVVNLLNTALQNDGVTIDWALAPSLQAESNFEDVRRLAADIKADKVGAVIFNHCDPVFALPASMKLEELLAKVPLVVTVGDRLTTTAKVSDWLVPTTHYLEQWSDASPLAGVFSIVQPAIRPLHETRSFQDTLLAWSAGGQWYDYLRDYWKTNIFSKAGGLQSFDSFWDAALQTGVVNTTNVDLNNSVSSGNYRPYLADALKNIKIREDSAKDLRLSIYSSVTMQDGRSINNGWLQELPDPVSKATWGNYLSVAPSTAKKLKLTEGDVVKVNAGKSSTSVELPVHVQPRMDPSTVSVALGYGQSSVGRVGADIGVNTFVLQWVDGVGLPVWTGQSVQITKTGKTDMLAVTQGHQTEDGRTLIKETTLAKWLDNPKSGNEESHALPTMWAEHEFNGYKWGMSIDMSKCIGCNACMTACQAENNVPVVGKARVIEGREMHWIRIDRYYSGNEDQPDVAYLPMLCQHCDNAPCETVCPVLATYKSADGLNMQTYNRCVGTRYCANNCPYKVRRFNFFDYTKDFVEPANYVYNPDVTVRSKGVMEKCTFCVQRLTEAKQVADDAKTVVKDDDVKTACQQTCPADAIVFGNSNDKSSAVVANSKLERGYHVLGELNTKPQITYLLKVRNREA